MNLDELPLVEVKTAEAANAAAIAAEAAHRANEVLTAKIVRDTLAGFFDAQSERERFISTQRIPFICNDIREIKEALVEMAKTSSEYRDGLDKKMAERFVSKSEFDLVQKMVYGTAGIILFTVITAIVMLVVKKII